MPLFRPFGELTPIFRLFDDIAVASQRAGAAHGTRSFQPRFDVRETQDAYELQGDLPGLASDNINIEWQDDQTLTISGHTSRSAETQPEDASAAEPVVAESSKAAESSSPHLQPTVEDDAEEPGTPTLAADDDWTEVTKQPTEEATKQETAKPASQRPKYWVSERSRGSFSRTWKFASRVDTESVSASLKDGILSIVVPKATPFEPKKVSIEQ